MSSSPYFEIERISYAQRGPFSLTLERGECVGLTGASGSGKSLFLRALADLDPHQGVVRLEGASAESMAAHRWRQLVALLPAESAWWADRVAPHFEPYQQALTEQRLGLPGKSPPLERLGLRSAVMEWEVARLSSGERQRLALLRLLARRPKVLLLDEPTANLDERLCCAVEDLVADYRRTSGAAVIWISHDLDQLARVAERSLELREGALQPR